MRDGAPMTHHKMSFCHDSIRNWTWVQRLQAQGTRPQVKKDFLKTAKVSHHQWFEWCDDLRGHKTVRAEHERSLWHRQNYDLTTFCNNPHRRTHASKGQCPHKMTKLKTQIVSDRQGPQEPQEKTGSRSVVKIKVTKYHPKGHLDPKDLCAISGSFVSSHFPKILRNANIVQDSDWLTCHEKIFSENYHLITVLQETHDFSMAFSQHVSAFRGCSEILV